MIYVILGVLYESFIHPTAQVLRPGVAAAIAEKAGDRVVAARLKFTTKDIPLAHLSSIPVRPIPRKAGWVVESRYRWPVSGTPNAAYMAWNAHTPRPNSVAMTAVEVRPRSQVRPGVLVTSQAPSKEIAPSAGR